MSRSIKADLDKMRMANFSQSMFPGGSIEQHVWLVWELVGGRPQLGVICTSDDVLNRYVTPDRKARLGTGTPVFCEMVSTNHWYGANDAAIAARVMRQSR